VIVGILGLGAIGSFLARELSSDPEVEIILGFDITPGRVLAVSKQAAKLRETTVDYLLAHVDVVVEAASQQAVREYAPRALQAGKELVVLSAGALGDAELSARLQELAVKHGGRLHIPSGAIGGLDALKAARFAGLKEVEIETTKSPKALGQPDGTSGVIFEGTATEAAARFPANINVAVTLGLAGLGPDRTRVRIVSDPGATVNTHRVKYRGDFGEVTVILENRPLPDNPKTSALAAYSALALIRQLRSRHRYGT